MQREITVREFEATVNEVRTNNSKKRKQKRFSGN